MPSWTVANVLRGCGRGVDVGGRRDVLVAEGRMWRERCSREAAEGALRASMMVVWLSECR